MYLEAIETAWLYQLLSDKLGKDITEAMFKYIDNKTERSVEATMLSLATKEDLTRQIGDIRKEMAENKTEIIKMADYFLGGPGWRNISNRAVNFRKITLHC